MSEKNLLRFDTIEQFKSFFPRKSETVYFTKEHTAFMPKPLTKEIIQEDFPMFVTLSTLDPDSATMYGTYVYVPVSRKWIKQMYEYHRKEMWIYYNILFEKGETT